MTDLPRRAAPFAGEIGRLLEDSVAAPLQADSAPPGAPNVVVVVLDDVGFGSFSTFGGPVPTPACDALAAAGLRYNQFHTTALCSPTRAAMLTGRNHHSVHMGGITEIANSFPGYDSAIPPEAATVAEVLRMSGYATGAFGKWHLGYEPENSPTARGFDEFTGFLGDRKSTRLNSSH